MFFAEELLNNFAQQIGAWRFCLYFLSSTRNDYVMMYSLTVFEVRPQLLHCSAWCSFSWQSIFWGEMFVWNGIPGKYSDEGCFYCSLPERLLNGRLGVGEYESLYTNWRIHFLASLSTNYLQFQRLLEFLHDAFKGIIAFMLFLWSEIWGWLPAPGSCRLWVLRGKANLLLFFWHFVVVVAALELHPANLCWLERWGLS